MSNYRKKKALNQILSFGEAKGQGGRWQATCFDWEKGRHSTVLYAHQQTKET